MAPTKKIGKKIISALVSATVAVSGLVSFIEASAEMSVPPSVTDYSVYTTHDGEVVSGLDDQQVILTVNFDKEISIESSEAVVDELMVNINTNRYTSTPNEKFGTEAYPGYASAEVGEDASSLIITIHVGFAVYAGYLNVSAPDEITSITDADGDTPAEWTDIALYIPNGVVFETVSQIVGDAENSIPASVTKKVIAPEGTTRAMMHIIFLKNGQPIGNLNSYGANITGHYHNYLTLDGAGFAALLPSYFSAFKENYTMEVNGDEITITAINYEDGDVLDYRLYQYPQDRDTQADKTELAALIAQAEGIDESDTEDSADYNALQSMLNIAKSINESIYYLQWEVDEAADELQSVIAALATDTETATATETESVTETETESESVIETESAAETESETATETIIETESVTESETESTTESQNEPIKGDADNNGVLELFDIIILNQSLNGSMELSPEQAKAADINDDAKLNVFDILLLKRMFLYQK